MAIKKELTSWLEALGDLVFPKPPICIVCNASIHKSHFIEYPVNSSEKHLENTTGYTFQIQKPEARAKRFLEKSRVDLANQICSKCYQGIELIVAPFCQLCGRKMADEGVSLCRDCSYTRSFKYARAAAVYNDTMQELIHLYKYRGRRDMANPLAVMVNNAFEQHFHNKQIDMIIPVPLHTDRLAERGFNQSLQISKQLSEKHRIPIVEALVRTEYTEKQSKMKKAQRSTPLDRVFSLGNQSTSNPAIRNKIVLIVDDIYTTGTTIEACSKVLKTGGAKDVYGLVLAR